MFINYMNYSLQNFRQFIQKSEQRNIYVELRKKRQKK